MGVQLTRAEAMVSERAGIHESVAARGRSTHANIREAPASQHQPAKTNLSMQTFTGIAYLIQASNVKRKKKKKGLYGK